MTVESFNNLNLGNFNEITLNNLLNQLNKIYSLNNILILDPVLSPLLNYLTPFQNIKNSSKCQNVIWFNQDLLNISKDILSGYSSLIVILPENSETNGNLNLFHQFIQRFPTIKVNLIVKDCSKRFLLQLNDKLQGILIFEKIINLSEITNLSISTKIKLFNWKTLPVYIDDILICNIDDKLNGINEYFETPISQVNQLSDALINLLFKGITSQNHQHIFKLRNVFGKGNNSSLLIDQLLKIKLNQFYNSNFTDLETDFYENLFKSNTDLVVIERNLDYFPIIFNQLNYHGIIDDLFNINFEKITKLEPPNNKLNDDLYNQDLKHLNFAMIGSRLNKLAKIVQQQFKSSNPNDSNLDEMKNLVSNLGNLSLQQDLIKKHTFIGEEILRNTVELTELETFINFQNDVFEMDYKLQLSKLKYFLNNNFKLEFIWSTIILISLINDGIQNKDIDWISNELHGNYGLKMSINLEKLINYKIIRVIEDSNTNDFFSTLGLIQKKQTTPLPNNIIEDNSMGITGGKDIYKSNYTLINKFWNLHPMEGEEETSETINENSTNLLDLYPNPSFTLPGNTVPLIYRIIESLYFRDFLKYKPVANLQKRPNWDNLGLNTMFAGKTIDLNLDNVNDNNSKFIIIVIIGSIARSEITCLKYLQEKLQRNGQNKQIIIVSNGIINNTKLYNYINS
ncbi:unnamed protein product [Candida verbasci]|uniref:Sec1-like protein n=1 Tax=Candida verbasci TaxID=1227364 RepID=A0A9W4TRQ4_9ASCO|nr:unnamed protein product [Candida verbasci]